VKCTIVFLFLVFLFDQVNAGAQASPPIAIFSTVEQGPTFMIDCRNTSAAPMGPTGLRIAAKLDGKVIDSVGGGGSVGPEGLEPAHSWKVMIVMRQDSNNAQQNHLDEQRRITWALPVTIGQHRIAFRCAGNWSEEIDFYWNFASNN
jgi:hypothetical protein